MRFRDIYPILNITPNGIIVQDPTTGDVYEVNEEAIANQARANMLNRYYVSMGAHTC